MSTRAHGLPADVGTYEVYAVYVDSIPTCRWSPIAPNASARSKISPSTGSPTATWARSS